MVLYALAIVRQLHWRVFPVRCIFDFGGQPCCGCCDPKCKDLGKHPRLPWRDGGTVDEGRVQHLWGRAYRDDGVGIVTGEQSGLWVLDVDPRAGGLESLAALEATNGKLPVTVTARTGSNGIHYYFGYPGPEYRNTAGLLGAGLDTRGDGGYVVGPPSLHKSGRRYSWILGPGTTPVAPAPEWLLALAKVGAAGPKRTRPNGREPKQGLHVAPVPVLSRARPL